MGRRKKIVEMKEIGQIETKSKIIKSTHIHKIIYLNIAKNLINDLQAKEKKDTKQMEEEKSFKKWEKLIIKTYFEKLKISYTELNQKLEEKYLQEEEVKSIMSELKIKIKEFEYIVKKQWSTLKKFNLQEKIYREESKSLAENESNKRKDIYKEAIEKLTAAHIRGFEPAGVLKSKILNKIQIKYDISENVMKELSNIFNLVKYSEEEENLLKTRYEDQVKILEKFIKSNILVNNTNQNNLATSYNQNKVSTLYNSNHYNKYIREKDPDYYKIYHLNKQDLKRYEKELEMKAGKGAFMIEEKQENLEDFYLNKNGEVDEELKRYYESFSFFDDYLNLDKTYNFNLNQNESTLKYGDSNLNLNNNFKKYSSSSVHERERNIDELKYSKNVENLGLEQPDIEFPEKNPRYNSIFKVKDILKFSDADKISKFKYKIVQEFKSKIHRETSNTYNNPNSFEINTQSAENLSHPSSPKQTLYKSKILNDLYLKLSTFNKLTDFETQILIYLSHVVVRDLVFAKMESKTYEGIIHPEELMDFLKRFKIEIQNNSVSIDGKQIESNGNNNSGNNFCRSHPGNNSTYSHVQSHHSNFSEFTSEF